LSNGRGQLLPCLKIGPFLQSLLSKMDERALLSQCDFAPTVLARRTREKSYPSRVRYVPVLEQTLLFQRRTYQRFALFK
jgi:hypothetical protein